MPRWGCWAVAQQLQCSKESATSGAFLKLPDEVRQADLAAALLHDPSVLFLDEPTIGVDVVAKERLRRFILDVNRERGVTALLTTHDMVDMEKYVLFYLGFFYYTNSMLNNWINLCIENFVLVCGCLL